MNYGYKRWALGYLFGMVSMAAVYEWSSNGRYATALIGAAVALFFADYLVAKRSSDAGPARK